MSAVKIHIEDVYKRYGAKVVLDNIDLKVNAGELCTVVGPSGCGKSTLLRLLLGQEKPDQGKVLIDGEAVVRPNIDKGIVYQRYSLYPNMSVLDNVLLGKVFCEGQWWNPFASKKAFKEEAMTYLERVRLADAAHKFPHELSGGMQQRAAIAQALILRPPVLMMDEPFGALDPDTRDELQIFLLELWEKENVTVFFVTHDLIEACFLGTRLLVISQYYTDNRGEHFAQRGGRIVADHKLPAVANSSEVKGSTAFMQLIDSVREAGFDPHKRQHVSEFNLQHPSSFQTLLPTEHRVAHKAKGMQREPP